MKHLLYLATIAEGAPEQAAAHALGLEIDEFCTAMNMDADFPRWDGIVRSHMTRADRFIFHAPFAELSPCAIDPMIRAVALHRFRQSARLAMDYGIRRMVVHSGFLPLVYYPIWFVEQGSAFFRELLSGLPGDFQIMIENVLDPDPQPLLDLIQTINDPRVGICLDVGHAHSVSQIPVKDWIDTLAPHIRHYHLHDNTGEHDTHSLPGDGTIGFPGILDAISRKTPDATLTFECLDAAGCVQRLTEFGLLN